MREDDLYSQIETSAKYQYNLMYRKIYQSMADVLLNAYNTSYTDVYGKTVSAV